MSGHALRSVASWTLVFVLGAGILPVGSASAAGSGNGEQPEVIALRPASQLSPAWTETFVIPYGDTPDTLGVSPGGDNGGFLIGPEYGAQAPDGTWWFLDAAKQRVARFSATGQYLEEVVLDPDLLVQGIYFQYQLPRVLEDGTLYAPSMRGAETWLLRVRDGVADRVVLPREVGIRADDGQRMYGFDDDNALVRIDIDTATVTDTRWFRSRRGDRFRVSVLRGRSLRVELPDADPPVDRTWPVVEAETGEPALGGVQVATDDAGTLHLYFTAIDQTETKDLIGYTTITRQGRLGPVEPARAPFGDSDPGSPANLGVPVGSTTPWLMFIDEDGARVFQRPAPTAPVRGIDTACPPGRVPAHGYVDVGPTAVHGAAIGCVTWWRVASGTSTSAYTPAGWVSRGQMATFIARLLQASGVTLPAAPADHFRDDAGTVHEPSINQLAELGIVTGKRPGSYDPRSPVSRAQTASLLVRAYELAAGESVDATADYFLDDDASVHEDAINRAAAAGFTAGTGPQRFGPRADVTRAQMASFLARVLDLLVEQDVTTPPR